MSASPEQNSLWHDVSDLTRLAGPVIVARASIMLMGLVDTVMVGRYATHELGYMAMGNILWGTLLVTCGGLLIGTLVFTANAYGAGNDKECGQVWRRSLPYAVLLGLVGTLLCALAEPALLQFGQTRELAHEGGKVALILGVGLPFTTAYMACASFLEGIKRPVAGMVVMIAANVVNIIANWMLIFGNFGAPELGAEGSAWATTIMRAISLSLIAGYIWTMRDHGRFGVREANPTGWFRGWAAWSGQRRLGFAQGTSAGIEAGSFNMLGIFAGWLGATVLAAYAIVFNVLAMIFMVALGFATATAVRVGNAKGAENIPGATAAGWLGLAVSIAPLTLAGATLAIWPEQIAQFYTTDELLVATAVPIVAFTAWAVVLDGGQVVMSSALRGWGDVWVPTAMHICSYALIMVPIAWAFTQPLKRGAMGLIEAIVIASIVSLAMLSGRYHAVTRRDGLRMRNTEIRD